MEVATQGQSRSRGVSANYPPLRQGLTFAMDPLMRCQTGPPKVIQEQLTLAIRKQDAAWVHVPSSILDYIANGRPGRRQTLRERRATDIIKIFPREKGRQYILRVGGVANLIEAYRYHPMWVVIERERNGDVPNSEQT